jgi:protein TonB
MPEYPAALPAGVRGRVVLELYISSAGTLDRIRVARAEPAGRFEQAALKAFSGARFTPGILKGKAVPSVVLIEVSFGD